MTFLHSLVLLLAWPSPAQENLKANDVTDSFLPKYISLAANINDFDRFADGGADANWYIGFNNAWIVKLPAAPMGEFSRAFIGAKVGRAKTRPNPNKPWLRELIPGKIYMAVSQNPAFGPESGYFLADTSDIPLEGTPQGYVPGVGAGEWFWAEIPVGLVSFTRPNYLIIWSPTNSFTDASSAPILAGCGDEPDPGSGARAWNNRSIRGVPPRTAEASLETPLNNIYPALAIKLVPANSDEVSISEFEAGLIGKKLTVRFSAGGENIEEAWVESSRDQLDWQRVSRFLRRPPFIFTLPRDKFTSPGWHLRGAARDLSGNVGYSAAQALNAQP
ncbi:MAG: hypothetical protein HY921_06210 [Elusimicrobia bacterium]|nr:hypothetical protein [Elusimicrobiota bacterium]